MQTKNCKGTLTKTKKSPFNRSRPSFSSPPRGTWQVKCPGPQEFSKAKKLLMMPGGQPLGGGGGGMGAPGID